MHNKFQQFAWKKVLGDAFLQKAGAIMELSNLIQDSYDLWETLLDIGIAFHSIKWT